MYKMNLLSGGRTKSANIVGQTMRLNPHGDAAIYETMVRLSKGYGALLTPFVDSKGNFGKVFSRDMSYAASRYTEAKLAPICAELFGDIDSDTVDFVDNYDGSMKEPALLPTTFDAMLTVATTMKPLIASSSNALPAIAFRPEPGLVVCDLDLVREAEPEDLKFGYAVLVGTMLSSSKSRWNQFTETVPEILAGEEVALVNAVQWSQTARKDVLTATNPSARHALDFGKTGERTLRACLGDAASQVPAYQLLSEGMRFEARLAHDACDFDIDYVFDLDDCLEDFGIEELAFDLEPAAYIEEFRRQQFVRSNRSMLPLPAALGAIRLTNVEDEVLKRHAHAYLASRKELL